MKKNTSKIYFDEAFISLCNGCILFKAPLEKYYVEKAPLRAELVKVRMFHQNKYIESIFNGLMLNMELI